MALAQGGGVAQSDVQLSPFSGYTLQVCKVEWRVDLESGKILVIDEDFAAGHRQQPFNGGLIIAPGGDQFASHGG